MPGFQNPQVHRQPRVAGNEQLNKRNQSWGSVQQVCAEPRSKRRQHLREKGKSDWHRLLYNNINTSSFRRTGPGSHQALKCYLPLSTTSRENVSRHGEKKAPMSAPWSYLFSSLDEAQKGFPLLSTGEKSRKRSNEKREETRGYI